MAGRKSDFTLPTLDDLFSTQELRDDAKLSKIRDIPLELIDDFPDHPFITVISALRKPTSHRSLHSRSVWRSQKECGATGFKSL